MPLGHLAATPIAATGLPVGMFCQESYESAHFTLTKGDRLLLYTDGLSEARDRTNQEYGDRLHTILDGCANLPAATVVNRLVQDMRDFSSQSPVADDLTVMAIEMVGH